MSAVGTLRVYGIANCDTVKKARLWLEARGIDYRFHDFRKDGVPDTAIERWAIDPGWQMLLNRQSKTWRGLDEMEQARACDASSAVQLLRAHPTLIKRPVIEWPGGVTVGFDARVCEAIAGR
jgi:Spx/MgsR family transcriptional regulator